MNSTLTDSSTFTAPFLENPNDFTVEDPLNAAEIKSKLDELGFVVVKSCMTDEQCKHADQLMHDDLDACVNDKWLKPHPDGKGSLFQCLKDFREKRERFPLYSIPGMPKKGFVSLAGLPHGKFSWYMRTNPVVKSIYARLYDCIEDELCVSIDIPFYNPSEKHKAITDIWCHADQNINVNLGSPNIYQGILYVWDSATEGTSNTVVIPKSHVNEYKRLLENIPESMWDGHANMYINNIPDEDVRKEMLDIWCEKARRIPVPAGGLLIFDSRTIHQGYQGGLRLAQPICWEHKKYRSQEAYLRKLQACHMLVATTHWASLGVHHPLSFIKPRDSKYDGRKHHNNVFPIKSIQSEALVDSVTFKFTKRVPAHSVEQMESNIKPEYKDLL